MESPPIRGAKYMWSTLKSAVFDQSSYIPGTVQDRDTGSMKG